MADLIPSYVDALLEELTLRTENLPSPASPIRSVYFGGGTPSLLDPHQVERVLKGIREHLPCPGPSQPPLEVTLEANPGTVDRERLIGFRQAGVNRLTIGVQTLQPALLRGLGRLHSVDESRAAVALADECGFDSLNIDLIYGLSGQSATQWQSDLREALALPVDHLSLYNLTIEEGTPFARDQERGRLPLPEEEACRDMYITAMRATEAAGFERYEVSNFARSGARCAHNELYWSGESWLGLGAGAHGFDAGRGPWGRRTWNLRRPGPYIATLRSGALPEEGHENLSKEAAADEALMLGLRTTRGLQLGPFRRRFSVNPLGWNDAVLDEALERGLLIVGEDSLRVSEEGVIIVDYLISRLASALDSAEA